MYGVSKINIEPSLTRIWRLPSSRARAFVAPMMPDLAAE